ncbi:MAG: bga 2 [Bacteroidetes bacterium]|nr:bga 2 [Bacteroidota bacterium]
MKILKTSFSLILLSLIITHSNAQKMYSLDASRIKPVVIKDNEYRMGTATNRKGQSITINNRYLMINSRPQIPVMGELQYSRMDKNRWEDEILKMKACGVNVIATYSFWNHHEEIEGQFDWSGDKDLRSFVKLCAKLGVYVYPRIGPWSHGEARNGGTPDWILTKKYLTDRSTDAVYQSYVERYFKQIGKQLEGLMYKDNGPIIGIQLENEYWKGKDGEPYMMWLKQTSIKYGFDVPLYTVTGWGNASVPAGEMIPLWGGYPDESWVPNIEKITSRGFYAFSNFRDDATIGNAQVKKEENQINSDIPYLTCEMGAGIFVSKHRRPIIGSIDGLGMIMAKIGSGGNLLGYYIFAGASNPIGVYSTMEENKDETGYWCELSPISYDFQAAIRESGLLNDSYFELKRFNYFLREFGHLLAPAEAVFSSKNQNDFQYSARINDHSGFFFGINYCRNTTTSEKTNARFSVKLKNETLSFPSKPINIPDSSIFVWPINMNLNGTLLKYATAQPLFESEKDKTWIFVQDRNIQPEFAFASQQVVSVLATYGKVSKENGNWIVKDLLPGKNSIITIKNNNGIEQRIVVLSHQEGLQSWILENDNNEKSFYLSSSTLYEKENTIQVFDTKTSGKIYQLTSDTSAPFKEIAVKFQEKNIACEPKLVGVLENAQWLITSTEKVTPKNEMNHRFFQKEFSAINPAHIKWAKLIIYPQAECRLRFNENWLTQNVNPNQLNVLDITGYVKKGDNTMLVDFPVHEGDKAFSARVLIEFNNTERLDFTTDASWLTSELYYLPPDFGTKPVYPLGLTMPEIAKPLAIASKLSIPDFKEWNINVPCNYLDGLNTLYLALDYAGDIASLRLNNHLIADNINNNTTWTVNLKRPDNQMECADLKLEITPWNKVDKIYFDKPVEKSEIGKSAIKRIQFVPEYSTQIKPQN